MITDPAYNKIQDVVKYDGSAPGTRTSLDTSADAFGGVAYLLDLGAVDPAASPPVSKELTLGIYVPSQDAKIKDAKVLCINGRMGINHGDVTLNAGVEAAYTANAAAGVASVVATSEIPKVTPSTTLDMANFEATEHDYAFLKLQLEADSSAATWDFAKAVNPTGFYLIDVAVVFEEKYGLVGPSGPAKSLLMNKPNTEIFVKWEDSLQLIGCLSNPFAAQFGITYADVLKGSTETVWSRSIDSRDTMVTGIESSGFGTWLVGQLVQGNVKQIGDNSVIDIDTNWKRIENLEFYLHTQTQDGQDYWMRVYEGMLESAGDMPWGTASATYAFSIKSLGKVQLTHSNDYWDHVKIAVQGSVT